MKTLVLIKLGGSLITDKTKPMTARTEIIARLGAELSDIKKNHEIDLIVGTGAGSYGHYLVQNNGMSKTGPLEGKEEAVNEVHKAVKTLNDKLINAISHGTEQFDGWSIENGSQSIKSSLEKGKIVSVYGDILARNSNYEVLSTEELFERILRIYSRVYEKIKVIFAVSVPGVLNEKRQTIKVLTQKDIKNVKWHPSAGFDITGGMRQKVESSARFLEWVENVKIVDGRQPRNIEKALRDENVGTLIE